MLERPSPNFNTRQGVGVVDMLVLHYTGMQTVQDSLARLCDPTAEVSAHYLIDEDGTTYRLVDEANRAWHAGVSYWRGDRDINSRSIGIELQNPGHEYGYRNFPEKQIQTLISLCTGILQRHPISPCGIVAHSDIAPDRKQDPGELFPWHRLAQSGIGVFPEQPLATLEDCHTLLSRIGYDPEARLRLSAFQRRFRPDTISGTVDRACSGLAAAYLDAIST